MSEPIRIGSSPVVVALLLLLGVTLGFSIWSIADRPGKLEPIVDQWDVAVAADRVVWLEDQGVPMLGNFNCDDSINPDLAVQFQASFVVLTETGESAGSVPTATGPPIAASIVCDKGSREFVVAWANLPSNFVPDLPANAQIRYSVSAPGHQSKSVESNIFLLEAP